jgi:hypothetical protein
LDRSKSEVGQIARPGLCLLAGVVVCVGLSLEVSGFLSRVLAAGCVLLLVVLIVLSHRGPDGEPLSPASMLVIAVALAMAFSAAVVLRQGGGHVQAFALYGQTKKLSLPTILTLFGVFAVALYSRPHSGSRHPLPLWWRLLAVVLVCSAAAALLVPRQPFPGFLDAAQGLALTVGILLLSWFGLQADRWTAREEVLLLVVLLVGALFGGFLASGLTPFNTLLVPGAFAATYLAVIRPLARAWLFPLAIGLSVLTVRALTILNTDTVGGLSIAVAGQVVGCALLLLIYLLPRILRPGMMIVALVGGGVALVRSGLIDLLTGSWRQFTDVTLAHRGYETHQVLGLLDRSPLSALIGLGPAATVNLTDSPDAGTLAASGRVLSAVDDVHLLPSWLLLKLGVAGLLWGVVFAAAVIRLSVGLVHHPEAQWDRAMLMFVAAGAASSLPAATNLFTNPLPALLIGVLLARQHARSTPIVPETPPKAAQYSQVNGRLPAGSGQALERRHSSALELSARRSPWADLDPRP